MSTHNDGYWGTQTATIDWCEKNYEVTYYIAEFWNTISNFVLVFFPMYGIYWTLKFRQNNVFLTNDERPFILPISVIYCYLGLIVVGLGSTMFHMTLLYPMQLLDELPMVFGSGIIIYANYELILSSYNIAARKKPSLMVQIIQIKPLILSIISIYCILFAYIYLYVWKDAIFHEYAYGVMVFTIMAQSVLLIRKLNMDRRLYFLIIFYYFFGFLLWNIDNHFCEHLKTYRGAIDSWFNIDSSNLREVTLKKVFINLIVLLLKSLGEFHSLWHIFTGYSSFISVLFLTQAHCENHLSKLNLSTTQYNAKKASLNPVSAKFFNLYYHLGNHTKRNQKIN
jgi:dihydroceramidase